MLLLLFKRFLNKTGADKGVKRQHDADESPEAVVAKIVKGDVLLQNTFIAAYRPFIAKTTSRFCKRYIDPNRDDEFSIAMHAFHEAIRHYSPDAGRSFIGFAETVIRRRLIDYVRKEQRHTKSLPYSALETADEEQAVMNRVEVREAMLQYEKECEAVERRAEIREFSLKLQQYGFTFHDLVEVAPKHCDSRQALLKIAEELALQVALFEQLERKRQLPIKELMALLNVSRKTLERNRKYVIAMSILYNGEFPYLQTYLEQTDQKPEKKERVGT
ncbi:RNA polymerase sigma factor SigI [Paenibacillaceae bacterium]|nr:RNA polymerase sigma factor SigI [Paenibacillaceae bacterium]